MSPGAFTADATTLVATLDALGARSPDDDASSNDWYYHLTKLKIFALNGDVAGAREL